MKNAAWHIDGSATVVEFETDTDSGYHDFKDGTHVVLDVLAPKTDATAYAPPGTAKPQATAIKAITNAQAQAIINTANQLNGKTTPAPPPAPADTKTAKADATKSDAAKKDAESKKPDAKETAKNDKAPTKPTDAKPADAKQVAANDKVADPAPATPAALDEVQVTDSHLTPHGAVVVFKGAGAKPNAVFIRGLTAWVVLENAPAFNSNQLTQQLGPFRGRAGSFVQQRHVDPAHHPEAAGQDRGAKQRPRPESDDQRRRQRLAHHHQLRPQPGRSQARRRSPPCCRAPTKCFALTDPVTGDVLTVIPGNAGRAMPAERDYAEFAALPTASGVVLTPYADDLSVTVANARARHHQAGRPVAHAAADAERRNARGAGRYRRQSRLFGFRRLGPSDRRLVPRHRTAPDPVGGAAGARQSHPRAADPGALLSRQSFRRRSAGPASI